MFPEIDQLNEEIWQSGANNPPAELKKAEKVLELAVEKAYLTGQADSLLNIGRCQAFISELDESKKNLTKALEIYRNLSSRRADIGEMRAHNSMGVVSFELQDYESALNYFFMVLTESEVNKDDEMKNRALNNIGEIHRLLNNKEEALGYYHQAAQLAESMNVPRIIGPTDINLAEIYLSLNDLSIAEEYFNRAFKIADENNYLQMKADALLGIGKLFLEKSNPDAEKKLKEAEEIYINIDDKTCIAECRFQLGLYELQSKNLETAEVMINQAIKTAQELNIPGLLSRCYLRLSKIKKHGNDFESALEYYEKHHEIEEKHINERLRTRLKKITILYETEHTETEKEAYRMQSMNLEKANKEIQFINEIGQQITSSLEMDDIIKQTYSGLSGIMDISGFGVILYNETAEELLFTNIMEQGKTLDPYTIKLDENKSLASYCIIHRTPLLLNSREDSKEYIEQWKQGSELTMNSAIFMPMQQRGRMIGCMTVQNTGRNMYKQSDLNTIGAVSTFLAIALDNSRVYAEVHKLNEVITNEKQGLEVAYRKIAHMANHDPLTNLPNRNLLNELLDRGIKIAKRTDTKLAVMYMDLDNFKPVNDTLGHESGDELLKIVADRLNNALRTSDTVARIGGDEFVAVLYNVEDENGVYAAAEKIIKTLGGEIKIKDVEFRIGVSIGISIYPEHDTRISELLVMADRAMYEAKQFGKNRALIYSGD